MAKTSKRSISGTKRNNQRRNKLIKKGKLKPNSQPRYTPSNSRNKKFEKSFGNAHDVLSQEKKMLLIQEGKKDKEEAYEQMIDSLDPEDIAYIRSLSSVDFLEIKALERISKAPERTENPRAAIHLLPIKTKDGLQIQSLDEVYEDENLDKDSETFSKDKEKEKESDVCQREANPPLSVVQLCSHRSEVLSERKNTIGSLSLNFLENPTERINILEKLIKMMTEETELTVISSVFKYVSLSLCEIFKDVLPSYRIITSHSEEKLKKDTVKLRNYEKSLLNCLKIYLIKLEKKLKGLSSSSTSDESTKELIIHCLTELLVSHPTFNYSLNIIGVIIPMYAFGSSTNNHIRLLIEKTIQRLFEEDKRGDVSLHIVSYINGMFKRKKSGKIHSDLLSLLLFLPLQNFNWNEIKEEEKASNRKKKLTARHLRVEISKKEKKRKKRMRDLEKELLEAEGQESCEVKTKIYNKITSLVFAIYFRILKVEGISSSSSPHLTNVLKGLSKFSHAINIDFFSDLLDVFSRLLKAGSLNLHSNFLVVQTVVNILSGQGDVLNMDPSRFLHLLYHKMMELNILTTDVNFLSLSILLDVLLKRKKKVSSYTVLGFTKRISSLALQMDDSSSLAYLALLREIRLAHPSVRGLLTNDEFGNGIFDPFILEPENSNAENSYLWELGLLRLHVNSKISSLATHIIMNLPEGSTMTTTNSGKVGIKGGELHKNFRKRPTEIFKDNERDQNDFCIGIPPQAHGNKRNKRRSKETSEQIDYWSSFLK